MSYEDPTATTPVTNSPSLGVMLQQGTWTLLPPGSGMCLFYDTNPETPDGKTPLVFVRLEKNKIIFMCGCSACVQSTKEDKKAGRVRYASAQLKWSGAHAHK